MKNSGAIRGHLEQQCPMSTSANASTSMCTRVLLPYIENYISINIYTLEILYMDALNLHMEHKF